MASLVTSFLRQVDTLFIKILVSFWIILLVTVFCVMVIVGLSEKTDVNLPAQGESQLQHAVKRLSDYYKLNPLPIDSLSMDDFYDSEVQPRQQAKQGKQGVPQQRKVLRQQGERLYLVNEQGQLLNQRDIPRQNKDIRQFILDHDNPEQPMVRLAKQSLYMGPTKFMVDDQIYLVYLEQKIDSQPNNMLSTGLFLHQLRLRPQLLLSLLATISLIACMLLAWHITVPLKQLGDAANRVAMGDLTATLPDINRGDEIGHMANSLAQMVTTLNTAIINQRRLLSDISHELRSPLTRLNMALGLSNKRYGTSKENERIAKESERLEGMISALLSLSRMQLNESQRETVELHELLCILSDDCEFEANQLNKSFHYDNTSAINLSCYPKLLLSAIENLCRNALKYASQDVHLFLDYQPKQLTIEVTDDGPGINENELEQIFRPFYRSGTARDRDSGGVGLGLAIADWSVRQHSGSIYAANRPQGGLSVTITLPIHG